ncbi:S-adenosyl-L-methionine-dependent methyltransferase [Hypoxylon rubiginosum]|uniref:S-adenosyl-L-methionine-dependent methyltransferase n=1 Tax=Hypoxylon rubiginosum TaxID=110542 RepID=A0ACC0DFP5_9PEZI|nr:S-adenosyl-L-methionine-dependent methyltransferase [Hypoxylon rubiginosum]
MSFKPKQIINFKAEDLIELQGSVTEVGIGYSLGFLPPFTEGDEVHDNACGFGAVTEMIMGRHPPAIRIYATDINKEFVQGCAELAKNNGWPVSTATMSAQELKFPDDKFTHSFTTFAFHCLGDHDTAAREVYRTLKPGGTAIASIWTSMPHVDALQHAHWLTRGREGPMPKLLPVEPFTESDLRRALETGGFKPENITCHTRQAFLTIPDLRRWAQLAWSYLGELPKPDEWSNGWSQRDEDKWDEAQADIVEQLDSGRGNFIAKNEKGETVLTMVACIAIATK